MTAKRGPWRQALRLAADRLDEEAALVEKSIKRLKASNLAENLMRAAAATHVEIEYRRLAQSMRWEADV